jgi:hypothetical protein
MKSRFDNIFWGILLILAAGLIFAQQQGYVHGFSRTFWMLVLAGVSLAFFVRYFVAGLRAWGWLFPACIFGTVAAMLWLNESGVQSTLLVAPIFAGIVVPFLVAFAINYRQNWWALIPAFVLSATGTSIVFGGNVRGELIGALFMFAIGLPFLVVYFADRRKWWALIPGFTMAVFGTLILLSAYSNQWAAAFITIAISLPFFYLHFKPQGFWWALIPAGVMASIGVNALLTNPLLGRFAQSTIPVAIMFLGWAATFGWLWRQREKMPTAWARFPAMVMAIIAVVLLVVGALTEVGLTAVLIAGGLLLIYFGLRPRKDAGAK